MSVQSKMNKGTERLIAHADIQHAIFPTSLFLSREELMNSERHSAKKIRFDFKELSDGKTIQLTVTDDGDGRADAGRLQCPSESNGGGTSRYAAGLSIARLKRGKPEDPWSAAWKQAGEDEAHYMTNDRIEKAAPIPFLKYHPWIDKNQHGFVHRSTIRIESLQGLQLSDIVPTMREIICTSMLPETLESLCVELNVEDRTGKTIASSSSKDKNNTWRTFEEVVAGPLSKTIDKTFRYEDVTIDVKYVIAGKQCYSETGKKASKGSKPAEFIPHFPNYGAAASPYAFISQEGFVVEDMPLGDSLKVISHSLNYKYMFVRLSPANKTKPGPLTAEEVVLLPTPASTKTGYLKSCPIYSGCMDKVRSSKPPGKEWLEWSATQTLHSGSPQPKPVAVSVAPVQKKPVPIPSAPPPPPPPPQIVTVPTIDPDIAWIQTWIRDNQTRLKKPSVVAELRKVVVDR